MASSAQDDIEWTVIHLDGTPSQMCMNRVGLPHYPQPCIPSGDLNYHRPPGVTAKVTQTQMAPAWKTGPPSHTCRFLLSQAAGQLPFRQMGNLHQPCPCIHQPLCKWLNSDNTQPPLQSLSQTIVDGDLSNHQISANSPSEEVELPKS